MRLLLLSSAFIALFLGGALAQEPSKGARAATDRPTTNRTPPTLSIGNPGFAAPGTQEQASGMPAPHQANVPDRVFLIQATLGSRAEVELARLAEQRAQSEPVREFARRMIQHLSPADNALSGLVEAAGISIPGHADARHSQVYDGLSRLTGPAFDLEYLRTRVGDHQRAIQLMQYEIGSGQDAQIQSFAANALPQMFVHLGMARDLLDQISVANPQIASAPPRTVSGMPTPQTPRAVSN